MTTALYWLLPYVVAGGLTAHLGDRHLVANGDEMFNKAELAFVVALWPLVWYWAVVDLYYPSGGK